MLFQNIMQLVLSCNIQTTSMDGEEQDNPATKSKRLHDQFDGDEVPPPDWSEAFYLEECDPKT